MTGNEPALAEPGTAVLQRPHLTLAQQQSILTAVCSHLRDFATGVPVEAEGSAAAGVPEIEVAGAFVSIKRNKHLRGCCGGLQDHPIRLSNAIHDAAERTALDDARFPPVSPRELPFLEVEVWLLFNPQPVLASGEDRIGAVQTGGKHGLVVSRGQSRGLLLPGVAADHNWDSQRFLEQVCIKAGLHPSLWKDDDTRLKTFEGEVLQARLADTLDLENIPAAVPVISEAALPAFADFCAKNIRLHLEGATPNYYLFGAPDGQVNGVVLLIRSSEASTITLSQFSLRPGLPLQATLFGLSQGAANLLSGRHDAWTVASDLDVNLTILHDPWLHGSAQEPDLGGLDARTRAILVLDQGRAGLAYEPGRRPGDLVAEAVRQARVRQSGGGVVYSLEVISSAERVAVSTAPVATAGPPARLPAVAGRFYPANPGELSALAADLCSGPRTPSRWAAAMIPHAGLVFSGRLAAGVLKRIEFPDLVLVIGPKHTSLGVDWAVTPHRTWLMPGFKVESDPEFASELAEAIPDLELDALAHQQEHAIEVELPLIHRLAPHARVVGVAVGPGDLAACRQFAQGLVQVLRRRAVRPLILISSDMNHFATDRETRLLDELALRALDRLDPVGLYKTVRQHNISMCGVLPAVIVLQALQQLGCLRRSERVGYATSADVTGDTSRVVGYAGMLFGP